ncbi:MAG: hypothetical protein N2111_14480, partial [Candidatus Sumerlaeaceae bacterium]|nr:hypothetical protein [Candidatus Sumerlaeaceae bacterium]
LFKRMNNGDYTIPHLDEQRNEVLNKSRTLAQNARARWSSASKPGDEVAGNESQNSDSTCVAPEEHKSADAMQLQCNCNADAHPLHCKSNAKYSIILSNNSSIYKGGVQGGRRRAREREPNPLFDRFWACYPRKQAKIDAEKAFAALAPSEDTVVAMETDVRRRLASGEWRVAESRFIPLPGTYLRQRRWEDEPVSGQHPSKSTKVFADDVFRAYDDGRAE